MNSRTYPQSSGPIYRIIDMTKKELLDRLLIHWEKFPYSELRLGQMIWNAVGDDIFYQSDEELMEKLEKDKFWEYLKG